MFLSKALAPRITNTYPTNGLCDCLPHRELYICVVQYLLCPLPVCHILPPRSWEIIHAGRQGCSHGQMFHICRDRHRLAICLQRLHNGIPVRRK